METKNIGSEQVASYVEHFRSKTNSELIDLFNGQVGLNVWTSQRAYFIEGLIETFIEKGINIETIKTEDGICLARRVQLKNKALLLA